MLKLRDPRVELTEHQIYKFSPVFPMGTTNGVYLRYFQHRERVLTAQSMTDSTPPECMMGRRPMGTRMKNEANELRTIGMQNQRMLARIAARMLEPSQIDNHNTWERPTERVTTRRTEMLNTTYKNLYLLKSISDSSSTYRRDVYLNDWVKQQREMSMMSKFCHDWRRPQFTPAGLCPERRRRARTAPPRLKSCGCADERAPQDQPTDDRRRKTRCP